MLSNAVKPGIAESIMLRKARTSLHSEGPAHGLALPDGNHHKQEMFFTLPFGDRKRLRIVCLRLCSSLCFT